MNNPYEVLGVKPGASNAEIKAAYKELVKKYHPCLLYTSYKGTAIWSASSWMTSKEVNPTNVC